MSLRVIHARLNDVVQLNVFSAIGFCMMLSAVSGCHGSEPVGRTEDVPSKTIAVGERVLIVSDDAELVSEEGKVERVVRGEFLKVRDVEDNRVLLAGAFREGWIALQSVQSAMQAEDTIAAWLADSNSDASAHFAAGNLALLCDEDRKAVTHFRRATELSPNHVEALCYGAVAELRRVRSDAIIPALDRLRSGYKRIGDPRLSYYRLKLYFSNHIYLPGPFDLDLHQQYEAERTELVAKHPHFTRARLLFRAPNQDSAEWHTHLSAVLRTHPHDPEVLAALGAECNSLCMGPIPEDLQLALDSDWEYLKRSSEADPYSVSGAFGCYELGLQYLRRLDQNPLKRRQISRQDVEERVLEALLDAHSRMPLSPQVVELLGEWEEREGVRRIMNIDIRDTGSMSEIEQKIAAYPGFRLLGSFARLKGFFTGDSWTLPFDSDTRRSWKAMRIVSSHPHDRLLNIPAMIPEIEPSTTSVNMNLSLAMTGKPQLMIPRLEYLASHAWIDLNGRGNVHSITPGKPLSLRPIQAAMGSPAMIGFLTRIDRQQRLSGGPGIDWSLEGQEPAVLLEAAINSLDAARQSEGPRSRRSPASAFNAELEKWLCVLLILRSTEESTELDYSKWSRLLGEEVTSAEELTNFLERQCHAAVRSRLESLTSKALALSRARIPPLDAFAIQSSQNVPFLPYGQGTLSPTAALQYRNRQYAAGEGIEHYIRQSQRMMLEWDRQDAQDALSEFLWVAVYTIHVFPEDRQKELWSIIRD